MSRRPVEDDDAPGFFNPEDRSPEGLRRDWWVYLSIIPSVWLSYRLLGAQLQDIPPWMRVAGGLIGACATWYLLKLSGLIRRIVIDPVLTGCIIVLLGAMLGVQAPYHLNRIGRGTVEWTTTAELPVLAITDVGPKVPVPGRSGARWGGVTRYVVVTHSPTDPDQQLLIPLEGVSPPGDHRCINVGLHHGMLGIEWAETALPVACRAERGVPGSSVTWPSGNFAAWRWNNQPGSNSEESP